MKFSLVRIYQMWRFSDRIVKRVHHLSISCCGASIIDEFSQLSDTIADFGQNYK